MFTTNSDLFRHFFAADNSYISISRSALIVNSPLQQSSTKQRTAFSFQNQFENNICYPYKLSRRLNRALAKAGLLKYKYAVQTGQYCIVNYLVDIPNPVEFNFQGVSGYIQQWPQSHLYYVKFDSENISSMIDEQMTNSCFPTISQLNLYLKLILEGQMGMKKQLFNANTNFVDSADLVEKNISYTVSKQISKTQTIQSIQLQEFNSVLTLTVVIVSMLFCAGLVLVVMC